MTPLLCSFLLILRPIIFKPTLTNSIIDLYILAFVSLSQIKSCFSVYLLAEWHRHLSRKHHQIGQFLSLLAKISHSTYP
ncbi:hypothetical protein Hanom_Chr12g01112211 [Helianthus anomalus]